METTSTRAMLVERRELGAEFAAITATIPRSEIEAALSSDIPAELFLDVKRLSGETSAEERTLSVAWERADLERLLNEARGDAITFSFAHDELERALRRRGGSRPARAGAHPDRGRGCRVRAPPVSARAAPRRSTRRSGCDANRPGPTTRR